MVPTGTVISKQAHWLTLSNAIPNPLRLSMMLSGRQILTMLKGLSNLLCFAVDMVSRNMEGNGMQAVSIRFFVVVLISSILSIFPTSSFSAPPDNTDHLFFVERSKNKNLVQYDVCLTENDEIPDSNPVVVYWVLEDGRQQELSPFERRYAYGIDSHEKLGKDRLRFLLNALKNREIIVERIDGSFRAIFAINRKASILERVYVESKERPTGIPKVLYLDVFGRTKENSIPIHERIVPK
jgi:Domain of unknown function (DUF4833)